MERKPRKKESRKKRNNIRALSKAGEFTRISRFLVLNMISSFYFFFVIVFRMFSFTLSRATMYLNHE